MKHRSLISGLVIFGAGAILGPLFYAIGASFLTSSNEYQRMTEAHKLVDSYENSLPDERSGYAQSTSIAIPPSEVDCGYEFQSVLKDPHDLLSVTFAERPFVPSVGYRALDYWKRENLNELYRSRLAMELDANWSVFEISFYRRCLDTTVFSALCSIGISRVAQEVRSTAFDPSQGTFVTKFAHEIACAYVDGIAAQNGVELVNRSD